MKLAFCGVVGLACSLLACACGGDEKQVAPDGVSAGAGGEGVTMTDGSGGESGTTDDACRKGCVATLAANCSNGPADQASCESTCHGLETGKCGGEYATFQSCAEGEAVTCGTGALDGIPVVAVCSDEQAAFIACING